MILTRDPRDMVPSLIVNLPDATLRDTGYAMLGELYDDLRRLGQDPPVLDARELLLDPRSVVPASIMPAYPWLATNPADRHGSIQARMRTLSSLGHPYTSEDIAKAPAALEGRSELDAVIAYLQALGRSGTVRPQP